MKAAEPAPTDRAGDTLIVPAGPAGPESSAALGGGHGGPWIFTAVVLLAAGGFCLWRKNYVTPTARRTGGLVVEETRALGNRQFLLVAACDGQRFLLGVAPGSIRLLSPLEGKEAADARAQK